MLKMNNVFWCLILNIVLLSVSFSGAQGFEKEVAMEAEESPIPLSSFKKAKVVNVTPSENNSQPSTSQGRLRLEVDVADDAGIDTISELITLEHIKASEIEPFIKTRLSRYGTVQTNDALNMLIITDKEIKVRDLTKLVKGLDVGGVKDFLRLETEIIPLKYSLASALTHIVKQRLSSDGIIQADNNLNVLIITDVRSKIDYAKKIIALLDIPTTQVLIEAKIIETSGELRDELGVDWWALNDLFPRGSIEYYKSKHNYFDNSYNSYRKSRDSRVSGSGEIDLTKLGDFINLLIKKDKAKLLSNPKIMILNNTQGRIEVTERIEYETSRYSSRQEQIGLSLEIIPLIGAGNHINMDIEANMANISGWNSNGSPIISEQRTNTRILVKDGETFIIGGLKKKSTIKVTKRVPILGYLLPYIFSKKEDSVKENDLLIFITPHIVKIDTPMKSTDLKKLEEIEKGK